MKVFFMTGKKRTWSVAVLILILLIQLGLTICFGQKKSGYFVDEILTYTLSNYPEDHGYVHYKTTGTWVEGTFFQAAMRAQGERRFDFSIPYHNQENDVHPPLYYFAVHFIASLFPGIDMRWYGLIPNMLSCLAATIFLYLLGNKLLPNCWLALTAAASWALSVGAMTTVVFIRMYAFLTLWCVLLSYLHIGILMGNGERRDTLRMLALLFLVTTCGILTQYYFMIYAFFLCGLTFLWLLWTKRWRFALCYAGCEFAGIAAAICFFPKMLSHIFGGYRGVEAFENIMDSTYNEERIKKVLSIINQNCVNGYAPVIIIGVAFILLLVAFNNIIHLSIKPVKQSLELRWDIQSSTWRSGTYTLSGKELLWLFLAISSTGYILLVAKIAPYQVDRYYMCIYPFVVLLMVGALSVGIKRILPGKGAVICVIAIMTIITRTSYQMRNVGYLFEDCASSMHVLEEYRSYPVVVLPQTSDKWTDFTMYDYQYNSEVFRCRYDSMEDLRSAAQGEHLSGGFILHLLGYNSLTEDELLHEMRNYLNIKELRWIAKVGWYPVYYCTLG